MNADKYLYLLALFDTETQSAFENYYAELRTRGFDGRQTKRIPLYRTKKLDWQPFTAGFMEWDAAR
jgi:hypothetical protein